MLHAKHTRTVEWHAVGRFRIAECPKINGPSPLMQCVYNDVVETDVCWRCDNFSLLTGFCLSNGRVWFCYFDVAVGPALI